ncbi:MAG: hypothetical protein K9K67_02155 [Bacteriovoracaceae bacterium]|nr:hypothetical protein [Bacteriovoracaceae bacterium]
MDGKWLSITEYSDYRNISISTVRRYIKANRVRYRLEQGKYKLHVSDENYTIRANKKDREELTLRLQLHELNDRVRVLEEENNDLKMLIQLYEGQITKKVRGLPEIPREQ